MPQHSLRMGLLKHSTQLMRPWQMQLRSLQQMPCPMKALSSCLLTSPWQRQMLSRQLSLPRLQVRPCSLLSAMHQF